MAESKTTIARYKKFAAEYMKEFNGKQAAINVGYSKKTAESQASRLLRNVKVKGFLKELQEKAAEKTGITIEKIANEYAKIAFHNPKDLYDEKGNVRSIQDLPDEVAAAITEIKTQHLKKGEGVVLVETTYKTSSKPHALDSLGKHLGFFEKDNKQKQNENSVIILPANGRN